METNGTIEFTGVTKSFSSKKDALCNVSCSFERGKTYFLYGNTGSGKTTFIRLLTREIKPDTGRISVFGDDITSFRETQLVLYRRALGVVWQDLKLFQKRTVFENVALPLVLRGCTHAIMKEKTNTFLEKIGLYEMRDLFPIDLPLGICQKIAVARALITEPVLILADEPMAHIDSDTEEEIWNMVEQYKKDATVIWATSQRYVIERFHGTVIKCERGCVA